MKNIAQTYDVTNIVTPSVNNTDDINNDQKIKDMRKKELDFTLKQIQMLQNKVNDLQQLIAQKIDDQFENLDRIEQKDQDELEQQQNINLEQQKMQQDRIYQQQQLQQQQLQQQNVTAAKNINANLSIYNKISSNILNIKCDIATTPSQQRDGLQSYDNLPINRGLWFPFNKKKNASFHMGNVKFPIDIIFIDGSEIIKIVSNIKPKQLGSWSAICTDVLEINGGICNEFNISAGDIIIKPNDKNAKNTYDVLRSITTAEDDNEKYSDFELEILKTFPHLKKSQLDTLNLPPNWELQQKYSDVASIYYRDPVVDKNGIIYSGRVQVEYNNIKAYIRIQQDKKSMWEDELIFEDNNSNDILSSINKAFNTIDSYIREKTYSSKDIIQCPECDKLMEYGEECWWCGKKTAQEHRQPDSSDRIVFDNYDNRNPDSRFKHNTTTDVFSPHGDGDPGHIDPFDGTSNTINDSATEQKSNYGKHFVRQLGYDPVQFINSDHDIAIRPSAQLNHDHNNINIRKLIEGSVKLFLLHEPNWNNYKESDEYDKIAIVNDSIISGWIDSLGFEPNYEDILRKEMFTDEFKTLLGDYLVKNNEILDYELFDSDLLLYK